MTFEKIFMFKRFTLTILGDFAQYGAAIGANYDHSGRTFQLVGIVGPFTLELAFSFGGAN